ncbi:MAG: TIGR03808 family TAT-translocated repetitive protein [Alphaproteobacteria bacterium]|nr:TIGR03808 family TAT-translocated repetitive protein [Alphaproteobacteria bacterium]
MGVDRRKLLAAGAGLGVAGAAAASAKAGPRSRKGPAAGTFGVSLQLEQGTQKAQTETIQAAIDEASTSGFPILLPPGRFVTGPLTLRKGSKLIGAHGATQLIAADPGVLISATGASEVVLEGLVLEGEGVAEGIIRLEACGGNIRDCTIRGARETGLLSLDAKGMVIAFNRVEACANNGIQVWRSTAGEDLTRVFSNDISGISARGGGNGQNGNGINVFRAGGVLVSGNAIQDCAFSAIRGNAASNLQVLGNTCRAIGEVAIYAEFGFEGAVISQNIVDGAATGIAVTNLNEGGRLAVVQGNLVRNLKRREHEPVDKRGDGITVEADTVVSGNVIENAETTGVMIGWGPYMREVIASGNIIHGADIGIGIASDPTAGACLITDNMISGTKRGAIRGMDHNKLVGPDLALEDTKTARVRITGNMSV